MKNNKYIFAFLITAAIFVTAILLSNYFSGKRVTDIADMESRLSLDILASETQFSLLEETQCKDVGKTSLSAELGDLSDRLSYAESQNKNSDDIKNLKQNYSLLEIKDYLLMKRVSAKCGSYPAFILYFYSNQGDCADCEKMGYVLTALHDKYPNLRIYSFDKNLDLEAIHTLLSIYKVGPTLPAIIINGDPYYGFYSLDDLETKVPAISRLKAGLQSN